MFLEETEQLIREVRGQRLTPEQKLVSLIPQRVEIPDDVDAIDLIERTTREPAYLDDQGTVNPRYVELHEIPKPCLKAPLRPSQGPMSC